MSKYSPCELGALPAKMDPENVRRKKARPLKTLKNHAKPMNNKQKNNDVGKIFCPKISVSGLCCFVFCVLLSLLVFYSEALAERHGTLTLKTK